MPARQAGLTALCCLAGVAMPLAFAPFYWWWLAPVCFAVLFLGWRRATPRQAFVRGWLFGAAEFLFGVYWIWISVHEIAQAPVFIAVLLMLGLVFVMALYPAVVGWIAARWLGTSGGWCWLAVLPALFVVAEWFRSWLFTGFGWLAPGYAQTESWLVGFAPVVGALGVSFAVFVVAGAIVAAMHGRRRERVTAAVVVSALFATGFFGGRIAWTEPRSNEISVALAQGAVPQAIKWEPEQLPNTMNLYRQLTLESLGVDLIVWPEVAIPEYYENYARWLDGIGQLATNAGSEVMLGVMRYHEDGNENTVFKLGDPESVYVKRHLVPYGEFFPMPDFIRPWIASMNLAFSDTQPGSPAQPPIDLLGEKIAVTICYEDVFGAEQLDSFPEATLLVNVSNDAWFGDSLAPHQHLQIARMRSAEVRRWQLRATNTGVTALIDPFGRVPARLPQFEPGVLRGSIVGATGSTPYIVWGDSAVLLLAMLAFAGYWARTKLTMRPGT
ncbi:MAG TPA: apolipoprotein N-acyltransferase [Gammaproteobacteria bacterium]|nr:apolipoprotein N-acyltransferase [Gammaproteobacteria bacterium]